MPSQLVAYSGFSAANYIQEPYSADLDFGTGEFSLAAWVSAPAVLPVNSFPIVGAELVSNGTFNTDITGWTLSGSGILSNPTGRLRVDTASPNTTEASASVAFSSVAGRSYLVSFNLIGANNTGAVELGGTRVVIPGVSANSGQKSFIIVAASTGTTGVRFATNTASPGYFIEIDDVSVKELGASLIADRSAASGPSIKFGIDGNGKLVATAFDGTTTRTVTTPAAYNTGIFTKVRATYTAAGKLAITVNGVEVASATGAPLLTMNNAAATLTIGNSGTLDAPFPGSITMLKLGATVPTPEQATFMYEQEKHMFRPDAQITLPAATSVLDLAYDEAQDKWMAVQAGYESSFTGLIRTNAAVPSAGSFGKVVAGSGVKALARTTINPGVDIVIPAYGMREELVRRAEAAAKQSKTLTVFDFDAVAGQTDFVLPVGWTAASVVSAGNTQREGATKNFIRLYDGFRETIRFAVAPGAAVWVRINAIKE